MPIYEYVCQSCRHHFEVRQKFSDDPVSQCERCGQPVTKIISAPAIMFKGSGWYVTDYSNKLKEPGQSPPSDKTDGAANGKEKKEPAAGPAASGTSSSGETAAPSGGGTENKSSTPASSTSSSPNSSSSSS